jgi:cytochrome P450
MPRVLKPPYLNAIHACPYSLALFSRHNDARWWPDAHEFRPERWLDEAAQAARPKFAYFPFGGGARKCIGDYFAWAEGAILLAVMARRWKFEPVPGHPVELNPTVTLRPKHGLKMVVREG